MVSDGSKFWDPGIALEVILVTQLSVRDQNIS